MFNKLRNKLILINLGITTVVIVAVFAGIYGIFTHSANQRPPIPQNKPDIFADEVEDFVQSSIENERQQSAQNLLVTLVVSGIAIELIVALVSYFLAEEAIKPVKKAYDSQKVFIANASHEIKTPLAAIAANLEAADIHGNKWIANVEKETAKLTELNNELLALARTDLVKKKTVAETRIDTLILDSLNGFESRLGDITLDSRIAPVTAKIDADDFKQIFDILMDNAIKYCDREIVVSLNTSELTVMNDGAVIPKKDLAHIFDRFFQVDKTANGVGLGLSIAKTAAENNGWKLDVKSDDNKTMFILKF